MHTILFGGGPNRNDSASLCLDITWGLWESVTVTQAASFISNMPHKYVRLGRGVEILLPCLVTGRTSGLWKSASIIFHTSIEMWIWWWWWQWCPFNRQPLYNIYQVYFIILLALEMSFMTEMIFPLPYRDFYSELQLALLYKVAGFTACWVQHFFSHAFIPFLCYGFYSKISRISQAIYSISKLHVLPFKLCTYVSVFIRANIYMCVCLCTYRGRESGKDKIVVSTV